MLTLVRPEPDSEEYKRIGQSGQVAFITEDVVGKFDEWSKRGVPFRHPPQTPDWGGMFTRFEDPDGNSFSLIDFDEETRRIEAQRRAMAEKLEAERRAAQEMEIATQVLASLFPQKAPPIATLDYAGICIQARQVGGDYYDFLELGRQRLGLVIGDIAGKGMAAALLMANLQASLRGQSAIALDQPERLLQSANQPFYENTADSAYATSFSLNTTTRCDVCVMRIAGTSRAFCFAGSGALERLDSTGTVLGLFKKWDCLMEERQLFPGDVLVLYTDGVTESFNASEEEFGEERLVDALRRNCELPANALVSSIVSDVRQFSQGEQRDDITLVVAKVQELSETIAM